MCARDLCNKQIKVAIVAKGLLVRQESIASIFITTKTRQRNWGLPESEEAFMPLGFMRSRLIPHFFSESVFMELTCFRIPLSAISLQTFTKSARQQARPLLLSCLVGEEGGR